MSKIRNDWNIPVLPMILSDLLPLHLIFHSEKVLCLNYSALNHWLSEYRVRQNSTTFANPYYFSAQRIHHRPYTESFSTKTATLKGWHKKFLFQIKQQEIHAQSTGQLILMHTNQTQKQGQTHYYFKSLARVKSI